MHADVNTVCDDARRHTYFDTLVSARTLAMDGRERGHQSFQPISQRWYVVHIQPHAESRAIFHLDRQGYRVFCPRIQKTVRHSRKVNRVLAPLFPGYLFVSLDITRERWRSVNGTRGVIRLVTCGDAPEPVPSGIVEALRRRLTDDGVIAWGAAFRVGQSVQIADGPFVDLVGILEHLDAHGRVRVLLDLLGRSVSVALRCEALIPAA